MSVATIKDVAKRAGVSTGSVSRYLNGHKLRQGNAERISKAIKKLGYRENYIAKGLKNNRSRSIGVVVNTLTDVFATSIISHLESFLEEHDYSLVLCDYREDYKRLERKLAFLESRLVDGVVVFHVEKSVPALKRMLKQGIAVVAVDAPIKDIKTDAVFVDNRQSVYNAIERIIKADHQKIGIIAGDASRYIGSERLRGYTCCMEQHGLLNDELIIQGDYTFRSGRAMTRELIAQHSELTALFVSNYYMLLGAYQAINELNISIPADISLAGFDHFDLCDIIRPKLSVIEQPVQAMGSAIGRLLIEHIEHPELKQKSNVELECNLLWRDSVAKPRS